MIRIFRPFEPLMDSGSVITTTNTDASGDVVWLQVHQVEHADSWEDMANEAADRAMEYGLAGYSVTAEYAAALADAYAQLASVCRWAKETKDSLRRIA